MTFCDPLTLHLVPSADQILVYPIPWFMLKYLQKNLKHDAKHQQVNIVIVCKMTLAFRA